MRRTFARLCAASPLVVALATPGCGRAPAAEDAAENGAASLALAGPAGPASAGVAPDPIAVPLGSTGLVPLWAVLPSPAALSEFAARAARDRAAAIAHVRARVAEIDREQRAILPAIEAAGGRVVARLQRTANAIQLLAPPDAVPRLRDVHGVARIERVTLHRHAEAATSQFVGAPAAWARTAPIDGAGVRLGIVDTGIDYDHVDFGGAGKAAYDANDPTTRESGSFPTAKVVGGRDFVGDAFDPTTDPSPSPDDDPRDCAGHGTAVASVAAGLGVTSDGETFTGSYAQSLDPGAFRIGPGVAPKADLYALKVFGCSGETTQLDVALEWAVDPDGDGDPSDRLDVVNASLGTDYAFDQGSTEANVIENLTQAGSLLVAAAGNSGDVFYVASSPAIYPDVLAAAALNPRTPAVTLRVEQPASLARTIPLVEGAITKPLAQTGAVTAPLVYADPPDACATLANAAQVKDAVLLVDRGTCPFVDKLDRGEAAGAKAVVVVNNRADQPPFTMGGNGTSSTYDFPGGMIAQSEGAALEAHASEAIVVTLDPAAVALQAGGGVAGFSSRGPSAMDDALKPDVAAPGVQVTCAAVGTGTDLAVEDGTSFASPATAGCAALVRQSHPELDPARVKALLMNTAAPIVEDDGRAAPVSLVGAGRARVDEAVARHVVAMASARPARVSVSFGSIVADAPVTRTAGIVVENHGAQPVTYGASVAPTWALDGVSASVDPSSFTVPAGGTANLVLTLTVDPAKLAAAAPDAHTSPTSNDAMNEVARHFLVEAGGHVALDDANGGAESIAVPFHAIVRGASDRQAGAPTSCDPSAESPRDVLVPVGGSAPASLRPFTAAFELVATSPDKQWADADRASADLLAVGVATDLPRAAKFEEARVFFAIAVAGEWTTPARSIGQTPQAGYSGSTVTVEIDTNLDGAPDRTVEIEPGRREGAPYSDVMTARVNDAHTGEQIDGALYVNMLPPDRLESSPFHNSVVVLPALLSALGVTAENPAFAWGVRTHASNGLVVDRVPLASYDPRNPALDTALGLEGLPAFVGESPVRARIGAAAWASKQVPDLLLLHPGNAAGKRWETLPVAAAKAAGTDDLVLELSSPPSLATGAAASFEIVATNRGRLPADGVQIAGTIAGARVASAIATRGACGESGSMPCTLGTLSPGASARVHLALVPDGTGPVHVAAAVTASSACDADRENDVLDATFPVVLGGVATPPAVDVAGGCGCRTSTRGAAGGGAAWALGLGALALAARRRRGRR